MKKVVITISAAVLLGLFIVLGMAFNDRQAYIDSEDAINNYLSVVQDGIGTKNISVDKYCSYSHQKFVKSLNCHIDSTLVITNLNNAQMNYLLQLADENLSKLSLTKVKDITLENQKYVSPDYIKSLTGERKDLTCGVHYMRVSNNIKALKIDVDCSGLARHAWYPIKG